MKKNIIAIIVTTAAAGAAAYIIHKHIQKKEEAAITAQVKEDIKGVLKDTMVFDEDTTKYYTESDKSKGEVDMVDVAAAAWKDIESASEPSHTEAATADVEVDEEVDPDEEE